MPKCVIASLAVALVRFPDGEMHENEDHANVNKFKYLRSLLEEPPKSVVKGI